MDPDRDDENGIGPDLTALERRLSSWRPSAGALDRDRMLYDAGRASAVAGDRPRRLLTSTMGLATLALSATLAAEHSSLVRERAHRRGLEAALAARNEVPRPTPAPPEAIEPPMPSSYLALTARLAAGVDDPTPPRVPGDPGPRRPAPEREGPSPLRPHDLRHVLDL